MAERRRRAIIWDMGGVLYRYFTEVLLDLAGERTWEVSGVPLGPTGDRPDEAGPVSPART